MCPFSTIHYILLERNFRQNIFFNIFVEMLNFVEMSAHGQSDF